MATQEQLLLNRREDWFEGADLWSTPKTDRRSSRRFTALTVGLIFLFSSCTKTAFVDVLRKGGFVDRAQQQSTTVDIICDYGGGSSGCTADSLREVLRQITPALAPGSVIRLQRMSDHVTDAKELARYEITAPKKKTRRAIIGHRNRQTHDVVETFLAAGAPLFITDDRHASPIAEALATALLGGNPSGGVHRVIVLTDARQVSKNSPSLGHLDFECGELPSVDDFAQRLSRLFGIAPNGVVIQFAYVKLEPVDNNRCDATVERYQAIKKLWTESLSRLGARVTWSMGSINTIDQ